MHDDLDPADVLQPFSDAPRGISLLARLEVSLSAFALVGLVWLATCIAGASYMLAHSDLAADFGFADFSGTTTGSCLGCTYKNAAKGSGSWTCTFAFEQAGQSYRGISYGASKEIPANDSVAIEFNPDDPSQARIQGLATSSVRWWVWLLSSPFFLIALLIVIKVPRDVRRNLRLLTQGTCAVADLERIEERVTRDKKGNDVVRYLPVYRWWVSDDHWFDVKASAASKPLAPAQCYVFFDDEDPSGHNLIAHSLLANPHPDSAGNVCGASLVGLVARLIVLAFALVIVLVGLR